MRYYDIFRAGLFIFMIVSIFNELYAIMVFAGTILFIILLKAGEIGWAKYQEEKEYKKGEREIAAAKPAAPPEPEPDFDWEGHEKKVRARISKWVYPDLFGVGLLIVALFSSVAQYAFWLIIVLVIIQFFERLNREGEFHFRKGRW